MTENQNCILVPRLVVGEEFYAEGFDNALRECQSKGFEALYMPSLIDAKIIAPKDAPQDSYVHKYWFSTLSLRAKGKTKQGKEVVVYAHVPHYFSDYLCINQSIGQDLINGAGILPSKEFYRLLSLKDDCNIFVVNSQVKNTEHGPLPLKKVLKHPQFIPIVGGRERTEMCIEKYEKEMFKISYSDENFDQPTGRLLSAGRHYRHDHNGFYESESFTDYANFIGIYVVGDEETLPLNLEQILKRK